MSARSIRTLAFWLAILFGGEGVVGLAHRAQRHVRCPEHGELVDLAAGGAGQSVFQLVEPTTALSRADLRGAPPSQHDEHEHCFILAMSRERIAPAGSAQTIAADETVAIAAAPMTVGSWTARPLYRIAPKNSPPA